MSNLLKMMPSKVPLPFKVLLGYNDYPTETNYVAATEMPQQGATQGKKCLCLIVVTRFFSTSNVTEVRFDCVSCACTEEKYTWLLHPEDLKGNTGVHYLVVRPIVGPGIKSINASLSITPITTSCQFWNKSLLDWSKSGCRVSATFQSATRTVRCCLNNNGNISCCLSRLVPIPRI